MWFMGHNLINSNILRWKFHMHGYGRRPIKLFCLLIFVSTSTFQKNLEIKDEKVFSRSTYMWKSFYYQTASRIWLRLLDVSCMWSWPHVLLYVLHGILRCVIYQDLIFIGNYVLTPFLGNSKNASNLGCQS